MTGNCFATLRAIPFPNSFTFRHGMPLEYPVNVSFRGESYTCGVESHLTSKHLNRPSRTPCKLRVRLDSTRQHTAKKDCKTDAFTIMCADFFFFFFFWGGCGFFGFFFSLKNIFIINFKSCLKWRLGCAH